MVINVCNRGEHYETPCIIKYKNVRYVLRVSFRNATFTVTICGVSVINVTALWHNTTAKLKT